MNFEELTGELGVFVVSLVVGVVSGLVPIINSEVYLIFVSSVTSQPALLPVALLSAFGQMVSKTILFYAGRGLLSIDFGKYKNKIDAAQRKLVESKNKTDLVVFFSATIGLPPFYVISIAAGTLKMRVSRFVVAGFVGRSIRFASIIYFPQLVFWLI
jgi:membrane protein YqaA with SNARE-associated domain